RQVARFLFVLALATRGSRRAHGASVRDADARQARHIAAPGAVDGACLLRRGVQALSGTWHAATRAIAPRADERANGAALPGPSRIARLWGVADALLAGRGALARANAVGGAK